MKSFEVLTIFPEIIKSFSQEGLIKKAINRKLIEVNSYNLRDWATDHHKTVDDKVFGGGIGMVLKPEPIIRALKDIKKNKKSKVVVFGFGGKKFNQIEAQKLLKQNQIVMICGRYDGIDERIVRSFADEEYSIGDYVLMGGEVPAMAVIEAVSRLIPGVVGKEKFLKERVSKKEAIEYPQYTRPATIDVRKIVGRKKLEIKGRDIKKIKKNNLEVPSVLLSGNHNEIELWKNKNKRKISK